MTTQAPADRAAIAVGRPPRIVPRHPDERITMTDQTAAARTEISARLMAVAEHTIVAEWICCEPLDPTHDLCAQGYATLEMTRALLVDDPEASVTAAPLLDAVMGLLPAAVPVPPPADQIGLRDRIAEALEQADYRYDMRRGDLAAAVLAVLPEQTDRAAALTDRERAMLSFALEMAQEEIYARSLEFTDEDRAALETLRRVAAEEQPAETRGGFELRGTAEIEAAALDDAATALDAQTCTCGCRRGAEFLRQRSAVIRATAARPAVGEQPETQEADRG